MSSCGAMSVVTVLTKTPCTVMSEEGVEEHDRPFLEETRYLEE